MDSETETTVKLPTKRRLRRTFRRWVDSFLDNAMLLGALALIAYIAECIDRLVSNETLNIDRFFGIHPRDPDRLIGIATAHWMHADFGHLFSNTIPFFVLGGLVLFGGRKMFWKVSVFVALLGGSLVWLLAPGDKYHVGASLVIFGYLGFLISRGIFEKSLIWIGVSVVILVLYRSMLSGVLPGDEEISWQGHLFGFIAGVLAAKLLVPRNRTIYQKGDGVSKKQPG